MKICLLYIDSYTIKIKIYSRCEYENGKKISKAHFHCVTINVQWKNIPLLKMNFIATRIVCMNSKKMELQNPQIILLSKNSL